jgi:ABC-type tungstate transport system substrate-binding protein
MAPSIAAIPAFKLLLLLLLLRSGSVGAVQPLHTEQGLVMTASTCYSYHC